jgi:signal transduction histidine kinase
VSTRASRNDRDRERLLFEAGLALASELELDPLLQRIVQLATEITGARYGALGVLGDDRRIARFITVGVTDGERAAIGDLPTGHGILGVLIDDPRPIRLDDLSQDPRSYGFPPNHPPMRSFLGVPVSSRGRAFGNLYLTEKRDAPGFDEEDEQAIVVLAAHAGIAIENARLVHEMATAEHELRRLEVLEERERIAKELHDGVIQSLFAVGMGLQGVAAAVDNETIARRLADAVDDIDRAIRDLRNYIFGLRPGILADRQLHEAILELCAGFETRTGIVTVAAIDPVTAARLSGAASDVIQLAREALANVEKHAHATTCRVDLRETEDGRAELVVDDDGTGFDPDAPTQGMGLPNLRERAAGLGGSLTVSSTPGEGTSVTALLPV